MQKNRLRLDWALNTAQERRDFLDKYLSEINFTPSEEELECAANYVLFGKDEDGESSVDRGEIEIETRNKTWAHSEVESLDALLESPTFNEASLRRPSEARPRIRRQTFSREDALRDCPDLMRPTFEALFAQIDELDLTINLYELAHGKRTKPPRSELLKKFTESDIEKLRERASHWNQFKYLKMRHYLVELRREQFTLRDSFSITVQRETPPQIEEPEVTPDFDAEIPVFPLGLNDGRPLSQLLFKEKDALNPKSFSEDDLKKVSALLWEKKSQKKIPQSRFFDFTELEHVYELFQQIIEIEDALESTQNQNTRNLINTLNYYKSLAELNEIQEEILDLKIQKVRNQDIANQINKKHKKSYTANYISTIFRQKIIPKINEAAAFHERIIENIFFEEEFKTCSCCGKILLRDPEIFVRKSRSKDGLANRCKKCDKADRQKKKEN